MDERALTAELATLLNRHSADNWADTPDYILAEHLMGCLRNYRATLGTTRRWHGWATLGDRLGITEKHIPLKDR